jgi:hypothetical protein
MIWGFDVLSQILISRDLDQGCATSWFVNVSFKSSVDSWMHILEMAV